MLASRVTLIEAALETEIPGTENQSPSCLCFGGFGASSLPVTRTEDPLAVQTHCARFWGEAFRSALPVPALLGGPMMHSRMPCAGRIKELHFKSTSLIQIKLLMLFLMGVPRLQWGCVLLSDCEIIQRLSSIKSSFSSTFPLYSLLICIVSTEVSSGSPKQNTSLPCPDCLPEKMITALNC